MRFNKTAFIFLSAIFTFFCMLNLSYADTLDTQLSRDKVAFGETLTVTFTLNSNSGSLSPDFSSLNNDFRILSTNYGNAINMLNGVTTTQTFWQLTLEPKKTGVIIIPEINFGNVKSAARKLVVEETTDHSLMIDKQDAKVFVQAEISNKTPYIQSEVLYTFKLFYQLQLETPSIEIPQIKDAMFVQLGEANHYQTTINGKVFLVVEKHFAIFPKEPGKIFIPSLRFRALTYDINTSMMDNPFDISSPKPLSLATKTFNLNVRKIPDTFQGTTWLPAQNISLTEIWSSDPGQWEFGNVVTRTITVEAQGLRADQIPDLSIDKISGVNIYVDPPKRSNSIQSNTVTGTLEQKVSYIPNSSQSFSIPAVKLNWWNSQTNTNAISQLNSITVQLKGKINNTTPTLSNSTPIAAAINASNPLPNRSAKNVVNLNEPDKTIKIIPFYLSIWFWIALLFFAIWLMTLWLIWGKRSAKNNKLNAFSEQDKPFIDTSLEQSDARFEQACEQGNAVLAQQLLLFWAKKQWQDTFNLEKLREISSDETFKIELKNLEQAIYAKKVAPWDGRALLASYLKIKKQRQYHLSTLVKTKDRKLDPLPPLNP